MSKKRKKKPPPPDRQTGSLMKRCYAICTAGTLRCTSYKHFTHKKEKEKEREKKSQIKNRIRSKKVGRDGGKKRGKKKGKSKSMSYKGKKKRSGEIEVEVVGEFWFQCSAVQNIQRND